VGLEIFGKLSAESYLVLNVYVKMLPYSKEIKKIDREGTERIMPLYTKKGDDGKTSIIGSNRLDKDNIRIDAYGTVDELNSIIGILLNKSTNRINQLKDIQSLLFEIGSELASETPRGSISEVDVQNLERQIDTASSKTSALTSFILPGGTDEASWFHLARTVARRAERVIVTLNREVTINQNIIPWINRLSDLFFAWARLANQEENISDIIWESRS
jgi:cob(I)alamin adenosyltransferase